MKKRLLFTFFIIFCKLSFGQQKAPYEIVDPIPKVSAFAILPDIYVKNDSLSIDFPSGSFETYGAEHNVSLFESKEKFLEFINRRGLQYGINDERYDIDNEVNDFAVMTFLIASDGFLTHLKLVKPTKYKSLNNEIIRVFKGFPKVVPPKDRSNKNVWTLVTCRIYINISPIKKKEKKEIISLPASIIHAQFSNQPIKN
ncbi:hypothetical protein [Soonwooa sp.]|uniref:hypothetical protein n=1 Tax=Soonwooa sp. TaxID=1938592 RepID=UPI002612A6D8|nr:hypothetical protein [Soonwooa sp.]